MHEAIFQTIRENAKALADSEANLKKVIGENRDPNGNAIDISEKIPETDYSFSDVDIGISSLVSFIENIQNDDQGVILPRSLLENLSTKVSELKNQIEATSAIFATVTQSQGGIKAIDKATLVVTAQNNTQNSFVKPIRKIFGNLDAALAAWFQLRVVLKAPKLGDFGRILYGFSSQQADLAKLAEASVQLGQTAKEDQKKIAEVLTQAGQQRTEVNRLLQEAQNDRKTLNEYSAEGTEKISSIRTTHQETTKLDGAVKEYQANFSRFDEQLKGREEKFLKENADLELIHGRFNESEKKITDLTGQAEGMLRGATNVGLAASFSSLQSKINSELIWARVSFYFSIFVMIILSIPIALYVFPGFQTLLQSLTGIDPGILVPKSAEGHTTTEILAQIAARALLLVPGIWLVRFTSARHERLFRLREHYAYKYSVASSVEGFKKQAPELEQGIAAATFYELTFNPATRMDANSTETRHPNPVMEYVMKKLDKMGGGETKAA